MKKIKRMIIAYLMPEYNEESATEQVCFAKIEKIKIVKVTYDNGVSEFLQKKGKVLVNFKS